MKKLIFICCLFGASVFFAGLAEARLRGYIAVRGGLSDVRETSELDVHEASFIPVGALGVYSGPFRAEIEYTYQTPADFETSSMSEEYMKTSFHRVMGNGYLDLRVTKNIRPYLSAGAGIASYDIEVLGDKETGSNFAWSVGGGLGVRLTRNVTADAGIRYVDLGKVELNNGERELSFDTVETYAGVRFMF